MSIARTLPWPCSGQSDCWFSRVLLRFGGTHRRCYQSKVITAYDIVQFVTRALAFQGNILPSLTGHEKSSALEMNYETLVFFYRVLVFVLLGALDKLRRVAIDFVSICPSSWKNSAPHLTDFHEISYLCIFRQSVHKIQVSLKSDKNNGYFTWRPMYIFDHISLSSS